MAILGAYQATHKFVFASTQAANSRLFEVAFLAGATNGNGVVPNVIVPLNLVVTTVQINLNTAAETSLDLFKMTNATIAVDTTNTVTPSSTKQTAFPTSALSLRGVTVAGAAAGMTGGTLTKDAGALVQLAIGMATIAPSTSAALPTIGPIDLMGISLPLAFGQNEGLELENRVVTAATASLSVYIKFAWMELG